MKHLAPDGRPFWSHSTTKQSVWEKPRELKTAIEIQMEETGWKEYESGGRPYWVKGGETTWQRPQAIQGELREHQTLEELACIALESFADLARLFATSQSSWTRPSSSSALLAAQ